MGFYRDFSPFLTVYPKNRGSKHVWKRKACQQDLHRLEATKRRFFRFIDRKALFRNVDFLPLKVGSSFLSYSRKRKDGIASRLDRSGAEFLPPVCLSSGNRLSH
ncbi:MAG: hypothetical protein AUH28_21335 [Acidobacteria bacterium 13_1_40CM_56_16]|nr:MAG: hypothetical protein AUH28_21335 [Acidobacteria bacterium 13_1_40CM_56_16]OLD69682.1 MAG: hypothetical protein AUI45_07030 [Acidobacteria bacterium 13_1_40CM_2_56_11]